MRAVCAGLAAPLDAPRRAAFPTVALPFRTLLCRFASGPDMPRVLVLAVLVFALVPARAQTPDPTDPARYYPLDLGNVWEYLVSEKLSYFEARVEIVQDTVLNGRAYVVEFTKTRTPGSPSWGSGYGVPIRFDPEASLVYAYQEPSGEAVWNRSGCPLNAAFGSVVSCQNTLTNVQGGLDTFFTLGDSSQVAVAALKRFASLDYTYVADIGWVRKIGFAGGETRLHYARIRGVEYGTSFSVAAEAPPSAVGLTLRTAGRAVLLTDRDAGPVRLDLFDLLGRRVAQVHDGDLASGERRFELPAVAPGLYVARAAQGAARASVRVVVVR